MFLDPTSPPHWRQRIEISGVNVLTLGIYVEVLQRWLGPISAVTALGTIIHPFRHHYEVRTPDIVNVLAEFANGAEGVLEFSGVAAFPPHDELEIYGTRGSLGYDFSTDTIATGCIGDRARQTVDLPPELTRHWTVEEDFIAAVKQPANPRPHPSFEDGVASCEWCKPSPTRSPARSGWRFPRCRPKSGFIRRFTQILADSIPKMARKGSLTRRRGGAESGMQLQDYPHVQEKNNDGWRIRSKGPRPYIPKNI